jgi:hypothetical protein
MADTTDRAAFEAEVEAIAHREAWRYKHSSDPSHSHAYTFNRACLLAFAEKIAQAATAAERERAAKVCEDHAERRGMGCAAAIRSGA